MRLSCLAATLSGLALAIPVPAAPLLDTGLPAVSPPMTATPPSAMAGTGAEVPLSSAARRLLDARLAALAQQADDVERMWAQLARHCGANVKGDSAGMRAWFGLWDARATSDLSSGFCRDLYNQVIVRGEPVKEGMCAAEAMARPFLAPGGVRSVRSRYSTDWNSCDLPMPERVGAW